MCLAGVDAGDHTLIRREAAALTAAVFPSHASAEQEAENVAGEPAHVLGVATTTGEVGTVGGPGACVSVTVTLTAAVANSLEESVQLH